MDHPTEKKSRIRRLFITLIGIVAYSLLRFFPEASLIPTGSGNYALGLDFWGYLEHTGYFKPGIFGGAVEFALWMGILVFFSRLSFIHRLFLHDTKHPHFPIVFMIFLLFLFYLLQLGVLSGITFSINTIPLVEYYNAILFPATASLLLVVLVGLIIWMISVKGLGNGILFLLGAEVFWQMWARHLKPGLDGSALDSTIVSSSMSDLLFLVSLVAIVIVALPYLFLRTAYIDNVLSEKPASLSMMPAYIHNGRITLIPYLFFGFLIQKQGFEVLLSEFKVLDLTSFSWMDQWYILAPLVILSTLVGLWLSVVGSMQLFRIHRCNEGVSWRAMLGFFGALALISIIWDNVLKGYPCYYYEILILVEVFLAFKVWFSMRVPRLGRGKD